MNCGALRCSIRALRAICLEQPFIRLLFLLLGVLSSLFEPSLAYAVVGKGRNQRSSVNDQEIVPFDDNLQTYLENFGYLPKGNPEISNLRAADAVKGAIKRLQNFAGLNETGVVDDETKRLLDTKRCGFPDVDYGEVKSRRVKRFTTASKWKTNSLTYFIENSPREIDYNNVRRIVYDASMVWTKASTISFQEVRDSSADINIKFGAGEHGDSYPFDGPGVVLGHAFFPAPGLGGDIHFDLDEKWSDGSENRDQQERRINLVVTAAHEFGHSLGLGHSKDRSALMYPYYKSYFKEVLLSYDDILGIQHLYGVGSAGMPTTPVPVLTTTEFWDQPKEPKASPPIDIPPSTTPVPHPCDTHVDAVARLRGQTFVFKNKYYWRFSADGTLIHAPSEIFRFWTGLPENLDKIDAIYEWTDDDRVTIFVGRQFYEFSANRLLNQPRDISELGLPSNLDHIDAAFVWAYTGKSYIFAGDRYWRLDEKERKVEPDYPRKMTLWENVPANIDAAFTDSSGTTYFFKDEMVYKFNDYFMRVERGYPKRINAFWGHCLDVKPENVLNYVNSCVNLQRCVFVSLFFWLSFIYSVYCSVVVL